MSGIYIHIPFCAQKCSYCDFYTQVSPGLIDQVVNAIAREIELRKDYLIDKQISTIYFGGGTPSLLTAEQFKKILTPVYQYFVIEKDAEITFEANPDDLTDEFFLNIKELPFNRISMGIQSFQADELINIRRRHTAQEAIDAVHRARKHGFDNISIDLIFGLPGQDMQDWEENIEKALSLSVEHISAYGLTYEPGTALFQQRKKGKVIQTNDDTMIGMYELMSEKFTQNGYERYEISNFARNEQYSRHNSSYWDDVPYLGVGPSAHSYDLESRQWNVSSNRKYLEAIENNGEYFESEILDLNKKFNDMIMVSLRTTKGINLIRLEEKFGHDFVKYVKDCSAKYLKSGDLILENKHIKLSVSGIHISNLIIEELFLVDDETDE